MSNSRTTEPAPTVGIWAEEPEHYMGRRFWVSERIQADGTVLYQGVVDGEIVPGLHEWSGLAQRAAVARIEDLDRAAAAFVVVTSAYLPYQARSPRFTRLCGYCGSRVGAQELCCGDHG